MKRARAACRSCTCCATAARVTVLLWVINFMNLLNLYSVTSWLPTVVNGMGYSANTAVLVGTVVWVGGTIGTFGLAWAITRWGFTRTLMLNYAVATLSIALIRSEERRVGREGR